MEYLLKNQNRRSWLKNSALLTTGLSFPFLSKANSLTEKLNFSLEKNSFINLGANENPYGMSPKAQQAAKETMQYGNRYFSNVRTLANFEEVFASKIGVKKENILFGAGSTEILALTAQHFGREKGNFVTANHTFFILSLHAKRLGIPIKEIPLDANWGHDLEKMKNAIDAETKLVYICNPNNPTGTLVANNELRSFCKEVSQRVPIIIDEAYIEYLENYPSQSLQDLAVNNPNILIIRTFSKIYGMAGMRIGYAVGESKVIAEMQKLKQSGGFNGLNTICVPTMAAALASLDDQKFMEDCLIKNNRVRAKTLHTLQALDLLFATPHANFIYFRIKGKADDFEQATSAKNIPLRTRIHDTGEAWCRVSIGTAEEMQAFEQMMKEIYKV